MSLPALDALGAWPSGALPDGESGIAGTELVFAGSEGFVSRPDDGDANRFYRGALTQPLRLSRSVIGPNSPVERLGLGLGELEIANGDGVFDHLVNGGSLGGFAITVKSLRRGEGLDAARRVFAGLMDEAGYDHDRIAVPLRARDFLLRQPVQSALYAGTGGAEGGPDLAGKTKPAALGHNFGVTPVYLGVIAGKHSYHASAGAALPIDDVPAFYNRGVALTKVASAPDIDEYSADPATGIVTIGGAVPDFPTCNIRGYAPGGAFKQTTADIVRALLEDFAQVSNARLDFDSFTNLDSDQPAPVGAWAGTDSRRVLDVVTELTQGATCWAGFDRGDRFSLGQLKAPGGVVRAVFDESNILDFERVAGPAAISPPAWRHEVGYQLNLTPTTDVAAGATEAQRAFMALPIRVAEAADASIQTRHPNSRPYFTPGRFAVQADAVAEAARLLALFDGRALWRLMTANIAPELDIGQTVEITLARFGFAKRLGTILGLAIDARSRESELVVFA